MTDHHRIKIIIRQLQRGLSANANKPEWKNFFEGLIQMITKLGQDMNAATQRIQQDEALIVALQAQVVALQRASGTAGTLSPEDSAAQGSLEGELNTSQPQDTTGAQALASGTTATGVNVGGGTVTGAAGGGSVTV